MGTKPVALQEQVIIFVGGTNDAPGFKIVSDGHGGFKIVPIPGWDPEKFGELGAALKVISAAAHIRHTEASQAIVTAATKLATATMTQLHAGVAGQSTVVVVAS